MEFKIINADCMDAMRDLIDKGVMVDSIVTDPPYGIRFMGAAWDGKDIEEQYEKDLKSNCTYINASGNLAQMIHGRATAAGCYDLSPKGMLAFQSWTREWAALAFQLLKPGGHILVFSSPRTYHRMATGIEEAGFEIRDQIMWVFGQGFPKSLNISKAIDKLQGAEREPGVPGKYASRRPREHVDVVNTYHAGIANASTALITTPATDAAKKWEGWGTALKPAHEPVVVGRKPISEKSVAENILKHNTGGMNIAACRNENQARYPTNVLHDGSESVQEEFAQYGERKSGGDYKKGRSAGSASRYFCETPFTESDINHNPLVVARKPLSEKTVAENVLKHGTGGLNIDGCRIATDDNLNGGAYSGEDRASKNGSILKIRGDVEDYKQPTGRFPANLIHDGSEEVLDEFAKYGILKSGGKKNASYTNENDGVFTPGGQQTSSFYGSSGTASRFYYSAKASKKDRMGSKHPTVKPISLMRYLCRLVTPKGGTVLDPFAGSGTTGQAAFQEGFNIIMIERESEYIPDIERRMRSVVREEIQMELKENEQRNSTDA
jgi:DNA modification methylase